MTEHPHKASPQNTVTWQEMYAQVSEDNIALRKNNAVLQQRAEQVEALLRRLLECERLDGDGEWILGLAPDGHTLGEVMSEARAHLAAGTSRNGSEVECMYCRATAEVGQRLRHKEDCLTKRTRAHLQGKPEGTQE